jgi:hypothetical protein
MHGTPFLLLSRFVRPVKQRNFSSSLHSYDSSSQCHYVGDSTHLGQNLAENGWLQASGMIVPSQRETFFAYMTLGLQNLYQPINVDRNPMN